MTKTILIMLLTCLLQGIKASTIDEVIAEMQPQIDATADTINGLASRSSTNIDNTHVAIDNLVRSGTTGIYTKIENLDTVVIEAIKENGNTIEECVDAEKIESEGISLLPLQLCRNSDKWDILGDLLSNLSILQLLVVSSPSNCIATGVNPDHVRTCIQDVINDALDQSDVMSKFITSTITEARSAAINCVNEHTVSLSVQIDTITRNFNKCVESV